MTYDGATMRVYLDADVVYERAMTGHVVTGNRNLRIGFPSGENYFSGTVEALEIWSVARTTKELAASLDHDRLGSEPGLVGYWPLNEGGGTSVHDLTEGAHHGSIVGDATWAPR